MLNAIKLCCRAAFVVTAQILCVVADSAAVCVSWGYHGTRAPTGPGPPRFLHFAITLRHATLGRTPRDEWSALRRDVSLIPHNTHNRATSIPPSGFEPAIPEACGQTYALDCAAIGLGASSSMPSRNATKLAVDECARNATRSYVNSAMFTYPQALYFNEVSYQRSALVYCIMVNVRFCPPYFKKVLQVAAFCSQTLITHVSCTSKSCF